MLLGSSMARADGAYVESESSQKNALVFNPGDLLNGVISMEYERALSRFFGLTFGLSVGVARSVFDPDPNYYTAFGPEIGARFHFIKAAPGGLWIGPSVRFAWLAERSGGTVTRAWGYGVGAAIGYNFIFGRHFLLQLGVGGGFSEYGDGLRWHPRFLLGLGAAF